MKSWSVFSSLLLIFSFLPFIFLFSCGSNLLLVDFSIFSMGGYQVKFEFLLDKMGLMFSLVVLIISFSVMMFTMSYMSGEPLLSYFVIMVMLFVFSMNLLIYFPNMISLLLGWDGLGLTSYLLVIYYMSDSSLGSGMITAISNRVGDALIISVIALGFLSMNFNPFMDVFYLIGILLVLASFTKSAQMPFSAWLPAAMAAPTPVSALVHSSTLVTAGVFLLIRFFPGLSVFYYFCPILFYLGTATSLMASLTALFENDLKKIIALSTLSQLGVMVFCLGLGQPHLSFYHLITHALFKALLFICAGTLIHSNFNIQDIRMLGNMWELMPITSTSLNAATLSLSGFPFMAGFYSKDTIMETFLLSSLPVSTGILCMFSVLLTCAYSMRLSILVLWSSSKGGGLVKSEDSSIVTFFSYFLLGLGAILGGQMMMHFMETSDLIVLPFFIKVFVLFFILSFSCFSYFLVKNSVKANYFYFFISMWFLSYVSSIFFPNRVFSFSNFYLTSEKSWMEIFSGQGLFVLVSSFSKKVQLFINFSFSHFISALGMMVILFLFFYFL